MPDPLLSSTGPAGAKKDFNEGLKVSVMYQLQHEFAIGGIFIPPMLVAALLGITAALVTARMLNRYRLSRHFFYPPLVFLALIIIYAVLIGTYIIGA